MLGDSGDGCAGIAVVGEESEGRVEDPPPRL